jgi:hypothetical protein
MGATVCGRCVSDELRRAVEHEASSLPDSWVVQVLHHKNSLTEIIVVAPGAAVENRTFTDDLSGLAAPSAFLNVSLADRVRDFLVEMRTRHGAGPLARGTSQG